MRSCRIESVARVEGLSTRYLQKLFKVSATSFSEYLRERRLERCKLDLANRALNHFTISALCFRWGFGDAANFSRAFTARYGVSPKAYRAQPASQQADALHDQRGRPLKGSEVKVGQRTPAPARTPHSPFQALLRDHARYAVALALTPKRSASSASACASASTVDGTAPNHYYLPVSDKTVHWGYLSRSLKPVISVRSGDVVTIETLTQHASDDRERMIDGDPGAESVFHWTADKKAVDRRGAGPDGRIHLRARRGRGLWRAHLHGPGVRARRGAGRRARNPHPRRAAPPELQRGVSWAHLRQQRGGVVGLSLPRPDHRAEAARGGDHLRDRQRRCRRHRWRVPSTTFAGRRRPTPSA
jgi:AraC-like DNA-binding protein